MCTGSGLIAGVAGARLTYAECPVSGTSMHAGSITVCARPVPACRVRSCGVGGRRESERRPGCREGVDWHRGWAETVGRPARDGAQLGGVRAHGRVSGRAKLCLPTVRSRACVDAWAGEASGGSFRTVAPVAVWGLGLLLREALVDYGNAPDNAYSQGGQELNTSAGAC